MRVLELGSYIVPAYAGWVLAQSGHHVEKWAPHRDPIFDLLDGELLWSRLNNEKRVTTTDAAAVTRLEPGSVDAVIDNMRGVWWASKGIDPAAEARRLGAAWVSVRDDFDGRSFDVIAQARAWGDLARPLPFYIGDTVGGLWAAYTAATTQPGRHVVLRHAQLLARLIETHMDERPAGDWPLDPDGSYYADDGGAHVLYRGEWLHEPYRDLSWRRTHLEA